VKAILAMDQGTSASKAALFTPSGRLLALGRVPIRTSFGAGGSAHQDPREILRTQRRAIRIALRRAGGSVDIVAAGIASQRSTFVLWERGTGNPIGPAPTWQSTEAESVCRRMRRRAAAVRRITGLPLSPHYSASKLSLVLDARRGLRRRAERGEVLFGNVATYLLWHFSGGATHATDPTHAARTLLLDLATLDWSPDLLALFGVPRAMLPEVRDSLGDFGSLHVENGRAGQAPVRAMLGDQQAALYASAGAGGARRARGNMALVNYGTGAFVLVPTAGRLVRKRGLLSSVAWTRAGRRCYLLEGTVNAAGITLDWLRRELGAPAALEDLDRMCRQAPTGATEATLLPAFLGLGSAHMETAGPGATAMAANLPLRHVVPGLARAGVEAIAHLVAEIVMLASAATRSAPRRLVASGTLARLDYLVEFQAALLGRGIGVAAQPEATLEGAALAAARQSGLGRAWPAPRVRWAPVDRQLRRLALRRHQDWQRLVDLARTWTARGRR